MTNLQYPIEKLHAFVDGELSGAASAAFLRTLSSDPALAREVAALTALKASVQQACEKLPCREPDLDRIFAEHDKPQAQTQKPRRWLARFEPWQKAWAYAGAVLVAVILVLTLSVGWFSYSGFTQENRLVAQAIKVHKAWLQQPVQTAQNGRAALISFQTQAPNIYVPDLAASKLRVAKVTAFGTGGVHVGYIGTHSCHLSLFILPSDQAAAQAMRENTVRDSRVFTWRANRLDYVLLAVGMDQTRLRLIAEDVFQATNLMQPFSQETRLALRLNRQNSQPCLGSA
ncbi:MAG: hypothetical protein QM492_07250 [Rhodobacterales bacterium]